MTYHAQIQQMSKMLGNLEKWLDEAVEFAKEREMEPDALLTVRLYPDMFTLTQQIQGACDAAKFAATRLADVEAPKHPDDETTLEELRARIAATRELLDGIDGERIDAGGERPLKMPFLPENVRVLAKDYLREFAVPNFYFHLVTAYGLLRQAGVKLGKRRYIGSMELRPA